jgi:AraC family transcriptional regulator
MVVGTFRPPAPGLLFDLLCFIDENLTADLAVSALAAYAGLGPRQLHRAFVAETGVPPRIYVERRRVHAAARMLERETSGLAEVASRSGFATLATFARAFRRELGVSPGRYRAGARIRVS